MQRFNLPDIISQNREHLLQVQPLFCEESKSQLYLAPVKLNPHGKQYLYSEHNNKPWSDKVIIAADFLVLVIKSLFNCKCSYLELFPHLGETLWCVLKSIQASNVFALQVDRLNPVISQKLTKTHCNEWEYNDDGFESKFPDFNYVWKQMKECTLKNNYRGEYTQYNGPNNNLLHFVSAFFSDDYGWKYLNVPFNVVYLAHPYQDFVDIELAYIINNNLLAEQFLLLFDDVAIGEGILSVKYCMEELRKRNTLPKAYQLHIYGWDHSAAAHLVVFVTNMAVEDLLLALSTYCNNVSILDF